MYVFSRGLTFLLSYARNVRSILRRKKDPGNEVTVTSISLENAMSMASWTVRETVISHSGRILSCTDSNIKFGYIQQSDGICCSRVHFHLITYHNHRYLSASIESVTGKRHGAADCQKKKTSLQTRRIPLLMAFDTA